MTTTTMATRVLLVEDDAFTRRNTAIYLRRSHIEVEEAANGEEALRLINTVDHYDILISDLRMPGMTDGMDVISFQQRVSPGTACILVTAFGSGQLQKQAQALGVVYLEKPITLPALLNKIADLTSRPAP
jgi:two-component system, response regulator PdtaR